jgi:hypothetical protein
MSYQTPDIWKEHQGQFGMSWRASWDEVEAVYPELISNLQKVNGSTYDDGAKYRYKVTYKPGYDFTIWRNQKSTRGNFNRPRQFQEQQPTQAQRTLSDTEVRYEELAAETRKWMQEISYKIDRLLAENKIDPAGIKPASNFKTDHGNEQGGDSGFNMDLMNAEQDDGLPEVETPSGIEEIDTITGPESDQ